ncbi:MAG: HEAT repeat domain-containing protein [Planctomycetes bacterium]|nr:HEAT repeat domain-containing protein [Planctomycetota bacterium]MCB9824912.1 HEAT repeat domain-containing protein [Planctomycetota bacterium]MCB9830301.1 HEAT repeat domain-containing protein [Planctomycetota bacterium]MCB9902181.1 HEAT repeat domain-containing protein [Planctomycetota bacterium]
MDRHRLASRLIPLVLAVATAVDVALPARADDPPKKRDEFDFGSPPAEGGTKAPGTTRPEAPIDRTERAIRAELDELRGWPEQRSGQRAAEALFLRGQEVIPYLVAVLKNGDPAMQPGAAWVLGKIGEPVHVQVILGAAAQRTNASRAEVFFRAAYGLSAENAKSWLISFLGLANRPLFRREATRFLAEHVTNADAPGVLQLLDGRKAPVRIAGLQLLRPAGVADADSRLLQALADSDPEVATTAAELLGRGGDAAMTQQLNELARSGEARERAYATLALAEQARVRLTEPFEVATLAALSGQRGLAHPLKLTRAAAGVGLAFGAASSGDEALLALLDQAVIDVLVDAVGGDHFRDYESVRGPAFAALRRLTGKDLPETAVDWAQWWRGARGSFRARRPLERLEASDLPQASVRITVVEANGLRRTAEFAPQSAPSRPNVLWLQDPAFAALVGFFEGLGIFQGPESGEERTDEHVAVTLAVGNQRRRMVLTPDDDTADNDRPTTRTRLRFDALLEANEWQTYVDTDKWLDRKVWWERNQEGLEAAGPDERTDFLRSAIVASFDDLPDDLAKAQALYRLQRLGGRLSGAEAAVLARELAGAPAFGVMEKDGLRWILRQGHDEVRAELLGLLADRPEDEARRVLAHILMEGGIAVLKESYSDPRAGMRAAGALATRLLMSGEDGEVEEAVRERAKERLRPSLEVLALDEDPRVSVESLLAMAYFGDPSVVERLETLFRDGDLGTRLEVARALGFIPGNAAHPFLTRVLAEERGEGSGALRAAALRSMARAGHKDAVRLLGYYLTNDRDRQVQEAAAEALAELGSAEARFMIVDELMRGPSQADRRARLVDTLGRFEGDVVVEQLRRHLGDESPDVVAAAALRGAERGMGETVPYLVALLRGGTGSEKERARVALEVLTSIRFDERSPTLLAERYQGWYERERVGTARTWFRDALKRKGYDVTGFGLYLKGEPDETTVPLFIRVLRDPDPVLRRNAAKALHDVAGRSFGDVDVTTSPRRAEEIAALWADWFKDRVSGLGGPR